MVQRRRIPSPLLAHVSARVLSRRQTSMRRTHPTGATPGNFFAQVSIDGNKARRAP